MFQHDYTALWIGSRVAAFTIGWISLYSLLLYPGEQKAIQNRLEDIWIAIDERANLTDTTVTAILSQIFSIVSRMLTYICGPKPLSLQTLVVSANLSMCGFAILFLYLSLPGPELGSIVYAAEIALFVACTWAAVRFKTLWAFSPTVLSVSVFLKTSSLLVLLNGGPDFELSAVLLFWGVAADICALIVLRYVSRAIRDSRKFSTIIWCVLLLVFGLAVTASLPMSGLSQLNHSGSGLGIYDYVGNQFIIFSAVVFASMNLITAVILIIPFFILLGLLLHKLSWPLLARAVYSIHRYELLLNKKLMIRVTLLALVYAFNFEITAWNVVLKIIGG